jgi:hypothetical protein
MKILAHCSTALCVAATLLATPVLHAQLTVTGDAAFNSQYQWRGLTTTNRPVVQPQFTVSLPAGRFSLTGGVFGNIEGGRYNDPDRQISENGGTRAGLAEYDLWLETSVPIKNTTLTFGALRYGYPNTAGTTATSNTIEGYVKAAFNAPLAPTVTVWNDVQKVRGAYAELAITQSIGRVSLGATTGWNVGQSVGEGTALGYFAKPGFTHADVSAATTWTVGQVSASPSLHVILGGDANTFVTSPNHSAHAKLWVGTSLHMARTFKTRSARDAENAAAAAAAAAAAGSPATTAPASATATRTASKSQQ